MFEKDGRGWLCETLICEGICLGVWELSFASSSVEVIGGPAEIAGVSFIGIGSNEICTDIVRGI